MLKIVICDDSKAFSELLAQKVQTCVQKKFEMDCSVSCFNDLETFSDFILQNKVDIVFLDIMVREQNTIDWSIAHFHNTYTQVIFMTAFPQCAYNLSESHYCYFLIKQKITDTNLTKALQRALQNTVKKEPNLTIIKIGNKNYTIDYNDIEFIETFNNNVTLHLSQGTALTIYSSLKDYAKNLPPNFLRCHKCYMINMNCVIAYEPHKFLLKSGEVIPIPPKKYKAITQAYSSYLNNI